MAVFNKLSKAFLFRQNDPGLVTSTGNQSPTKIPQSLICYESPEKSYKNAGLIH